MLTDLLSVYVHERLMMRLIIVLACVFSGTALACDLKVDSAWIREAPSTAKALAGYALLSNVGSKPVTVVSGSSSAFAKVEMHETVTENGIAKMRPIEKLEIPAKGKIEFAPSGKHFMLLEPKAALKNGDVVSVSLKDATGCQTTVQFKVGAGASQSAETMDQSKMDHSKMDHSMHH